ncbi:acetyl-CoA carboxylase subunit alpha [Candidatus Riesia sp. GBBU]|nr:acetyl-CoA carboxylase subunit alpha [Candidatus Riesia sp. GBBU]
MNINFLDFEQPIAELDERIKSLKMLKLKRENLDLLQKKINKLQRKKLFLMKNIFSNLEAWQITQLSRHPMRPYTMDYIYNIFTNFHELSGDRTYADDKSIIGGLARLNGKPVMVIGNQKGREVKDRIKRNFGMSYPEGYRKALRLMKIANRFKLPIITFIDTPGAYPGIGAEERGQSEAIARNLIEMSQFLVPIICTVIGEGGSGGALAIGVGDKINMLQYSTYSVISPEGCASLLWKDTDKAPLAAEIMGITAKFLKKMNLIDNIVKEPLGGAHRNYKQSAINVKNRILQDLNETESLDSKELKKIRYDKIMKYGYD